MSLEPRKLNAFDLVPIIQMVLRFFGVYFFVVGAAATVEDILEVVRLQPVPYEIEYRSLLDYFGTRIWGSLLYLIAGIYLLVGGRCLIENVFLPSAKQQDELSENEDVAETKSA